LTTFIDHKHKENPHRFTYDEAGRLVKDEDPAGGYTELIRSELPDQNGFKVEVRTAEGLVSTYRTGCKWQYWTRYHNRWA
jgi:YD repeat-containing protein